MTEVKEIINSLEETAESITKHSDKLSEKLCVIDKIVGVIAQKAGFEFTSYQCHNRDDFDGGCDEAFLSIAKAYRCDEKLGGINYWGIFVVFNPDMHDESFHILIDSTRYNKKEAIKAIPAFLNEYASFLKGKEADYKEAAELSEKIQKAIQ